MDEDHHRPRVGGDRSGEKTLRLKQSLTGRLEPARPNRGEHLFLDFGGTVGVGGEPALPRRDRLGARKRSGPTGGAAKGMPFQLIVPDRVRLPRTPTTVPSAVTIASFIAVIIDRVNRLRLVP